MQGFAWEKSYPAGVRADAPIAISTVPALLDEAVARFGERTAFSFRGDETSYAAFGESSDRFAGALARVGLGEGDTIALYLPNTPYHPLAFFGALKAGARIVHLSPLDAPRELAHKLADSGARTLVTTDVGRFVETATAFLAEGLLDRVIVGEDGAGTPVAPRAGVTTYADFVADAPAMTARPVADPDAIALLQYTGGTTGMPKGAMLSHANLTAAVSSYEAWAAGEPPDGVAKVICALPLFHIYALTTILLRGVRRGSHLVLLMRFDPEAVLREIEIGRASAFPGVPTMWIALVEQPGIERRDLSSLMHCSSGGAPLPVEVAARFERLTGHRLGGGWGMTETAPAGTQIPKHGPPKPGTIGLPLPGVELEIVALDDPTRRLPPGEIGEIRVRGRNVTRGYWNRPQENAACFVGEFFLTGDIGFMDEDGYFFIVDRKKDMIISGGFNVYPQAIEQALHEHPAIAEAAVIGIPDAYRGEAAKAFVVLREGVPEFGLDELNAFLASRLGKASLPAALEIRAALPHTPVGKLAKSVLRAEEAGARS